jgi:hypothetical protein
VAGRQEEARQYLRLNHTSFVRRRGAKARILSAIVLLAVAAGFLLLGSAKKYAQSIDCKSRMSAIGVASLVWQGDNGGHVPTNFISMSNEINNLSVLICPSDTSRSARSDWSSVTTSNCSYEIVATGLTEKDTNAVWLRCKIHGFVCHVDASVFDGNKRLEKW